MKFVNETLDQVLSEWVDRSEDRWANKRIDQHFRQKAGLNNSESPGAILNDPDWVDLPTTHDEIGKSLKNLLDFTNNREVTPDEFKNFCIWVTRLSINEKEAELIISALMSHHEYIYRDIKGGIGRYSAGMDIIEDKLGGEDKLGYENS